MRLFVFGYGFSARALARRLGPQGWSVAATFRDEGGAARLAAEGIEPVPLNDPDAIAAEVGSAQAVLITAPPTALGCPALPALVRTIVRPVMISSSSPAPVTST